MEGRRCDTGNRESVARKDNHLSDELAIACKPPLPESCTDDHRRKTIIAAREAVTKHHGKFEYIEEIRRYGLPPDALGLPATADGCRNKLIKRGDGRERFRLIAEIVIDRLRKFVAALLATLRDMKR